MHKYKINNNNKTIFFFSLHSILFLKNYILMTFFCLYLTKTEKNDSLQKGRYTVPIPIKYNYFKLMVMYKIHIILFCCIYYVPI